MHSKQYVPTLGAESGSQVNSDMITSAFDMVFEKLSVRGYVQMQTFTEDQNLRENITTISECIFKWSLFVFNIIMNLVTVQ